MQTVRERERENQMIRYIFATIQTLREKAAASNRRTSESMVAKSLTRNPPSFYEVGDKVLIRI